MKRPVTLSINGASHTVQVEPRALLTHVLRDDLDLTGTHHRLRYQPVRRAAVAQEAMANVEVVGDLHAPAPYRRQLARVVIGRAVTAAMARAG